MSLAMFRNNVERFVLCYYWEHEMMNRPSGIYAAARGFLFTWLGSLLPFWRSLPLRPSEEGGEA